MDKAPNCTSESLGWEIWKDPVREPLGEDIQQPPKVAIPPDHCRLSVLCKCNSKDKERKNAVVSLPLVPVPHKHNNRYYNHVDDCLL